MTIAHGSDDVMPPRAYRSMHPGARLSETEKDTFCSWADQLRNPAPILLGGQLHESSTETAKSKPAPAHP